MAMTISACTRIALNLEQEAAANAVAIVLAESLPTP